MASIRELSTEDYSEWKRLYADYASVWKENIDEARLKKVYHMIVDPLIPVHGLAAVDSNELIGFAHYIKYPSTYSTSITCYLEDLYVVPKARNKGVARLLLDNLYLKGKNEGWGNLYWQTRPDNEKAINLYSKIAQKSDWVYFEKTFGES